MKYSRDYLNKIKEKILDVSYELFYTEGIDKVSIHKVASKVGIGFTSLYRNFPSKAKLVLEIAKNKWNKYYLEVEEKYKSLNGDKFSFYEELEFYIDCYIDLYLKHKELLKFNFYFETFISNEDIKKEDMKDFIEVFMLFKNKFNNTFKKYHDGSIKKDIKEDDLFYGIMHQFLSTLTKYASGVIFTLDEKDSYLNEIKLLKNAYLNYIKN